MKFHFILLFLLFSTLSAFAQPQKGDYFLGASNLSFNHPREGTNVLGLSPTFGVFVGNNTLVGGSLSFSSLLGEGNNSQTQVAVFVNQFIGKGRLKGLTSLQVTHVEEVTFTDLQIGAAFFPVDNASINLVYRIIPFAARNGDFNAFPNNFRPDIGLSMRFFLLRNREEVEPILARNSILGGTKVVGFSGNFEKGRNTNTLLFNGTSKFFLKDNFFVAANLNGLLFDYRSSSRKNQFAFIPQIGAGYYIDIANDFALRFDALLSVGSVNETSFNRPDVLKTRIKSGLISGGFAIFKGRHKIEPTLGVDLFTIKIKDAGAETANAVNFQIKLDYEYFLSKNTSLTGVLTVLPQNTTFRASRFAGSGLNSGFFEAENNPFDIAIGFNYYIMR